MNYHVKQLDYKQGHWVEVSSARSDVSREAWLLPRSMSEENMLEIAQWVIEHDLGSRQSYNQWRLKDASAVLAFKLKWG